MGLLLTLIPLFIAMAFLFAGNTLFMNSVSGYLNAAGIDSLLIGAVNSSFFIGATISSVSAHLIIARVGYIRSFIVGSSMMCIGVLFHELTDSVWAMIFLRAFQGFGYYSVLMVIESWLNERADSSIRSRVLAYYEVVFYSASSVGALIMGLSLDIKTTFTVSALFICIAIIPIGLTKISAPEIKKTSRVSIPRIFDVTRLAILGSFIGGIFVNGFMTMAPVFVLQKNLTLEHASIFITAAMVGGFVVQLPLGKLSDTISRRLAIVIAAALALMAATAILLVQNIYLLYFAGFLLGCGSFPLYSLSLARANDRFSNNEHIDIVEIGRSLLFTYGLASFIAPLLFGLFMTIFGSVGFNFIYIGLAAFLICFSFTRIVVPKEERGSYVPMPASATTVLSHLDPRTENDDSSNSQSAGSAGVAANTADSKPQAQPKR